MSNELEQVGKELVDAKAEMLALKAVLDKKKMAPEGVDATLFNRYKEFPEAQARTMVVGLQTTIGALEEQKARLGPTLDLARQPKSYPQPSPRHMSGEDMLKNVTFQELTPKLTGPPLRSVIPKLPAAQSGGSEEDLQKLYKDVAIGSQYKLIVTKDDMVFTSANANLRWKPDLTLYTAGQIQPTGIVAFIELKAPKHGERPPSHSSDEAKQILECLHATLTIQKHRSHVYGVLTNHRYLTLYSAQRSQDSKDIIYQCHYSGSYNAKYLQWLLKMTPAQHGIVKPKVTFCDAEIELVNYIGSGQFSHGFEHEVSPTKEKVVFKQFRDKRDAQKERDVCNALAAVQGVARLYDDQPTEDLFVAITPRGYPFDLDTRKINKTHVEQLVKAVKGLHTAGYIHGDICPSNIFFVSETEAFLNDWSHVQKKGETKNTVDTDLFALLNTIYSLGTPDVVKLAYQLCAPEEKKDELATKKKKQ